ncbi:MAG: serine/threonine protein kinase [Sandaracinaceae bacterium]|nr:serine/threonine protein kinase [Sandaracinaceae bacterium]
MSRETPATPDATHEPLGSSPAFEVSKVEGRDRRLGRYELIYEIGHGGMANVFLARARGPAGFQRWFAIKRVHDQLAKNRDFVNMFLDEARIAAAIQHPNVAQVFDLGEVDGRYFLAMEYLHGEPLTSLATRFSVAVGRMPPGLAAYLVARAADGLHHAHEATDASGQPMNLVHRDVSPHNVFITYDGQVKLTDFGVAKAAGRITHTETGVVKGKLAYASPEQVKGAPLDRRSDLFALGVILWEISTGRRLFRGSTDAETLHRIYSGYRLSPSALVPGFPPELERIIDRALANDPDARYPTAQELARDLDRFLATSSAPAGSADLARAMREHFAAQIAQKDAILHRDGSPPEADEVPIDVEVDEPSRSHTRRTDASSSATPSAPAGLRKGPPIAAIAAVSLLLLAAAAAGAYFALATPPTSVVRVDTTPSGARVIIDGEPVDGRTPLLVEALERGAHRLRAELDGHAPFEGTFEAAGDRVELHYALSEEPAVVAAAPPDGPPAAGVGETPGTAEPPGTAATEAPATEAPATEAPATEPTATAEPPRAGRAGRRAPPRDPSPAPAATGSATLTLITRPWARVWINGEEAGNTPVYRRRVPAGVVRVRLQREGAGPFRELTIPATDGESVSRNIALE